MFGGFQVGPFQPLPAYQQVSGAITPTGPTPAGHAGHKKLHLRTIYRVAVDTQTFEFKSLADALRFLEKTKDLAREYAQKVTREATEKQRIAPYRVPVPKLPPPAIEASSRVLRGAVAETKREIATIYRQALVDAEIAMIMELDARSEHNEDISLLFLM